MTAPVPSADEPFVPGGIIQPYKVAAWMPMPSATLDEALDEGDWVKEALDGAMDRRDAWLVLRGRETLSDNGDDW